MFDHRTEKLSSYCPRLLHKLTIVITARPFKGEPNPQFDDDFEMVSAIISNYIGLASFFPTESHHNIKPAPVRKSVGSSVSVSVSVTIGRLLRDDGHLFHQNSPLFHCVCMLTIPPFSRKLPHTVSYLFILFLFCPIDVNWRLIVPYLPREHSYSRLRSSRDHHVSCHRLLLPPPLCFTAVFLIRSW
jgi:hypothetical protein